MRAKEVGVRKALGSRRYKLIRHFLSETIILAFISGIVAFIIVYAALPYFSRWLGGFAGKTLSIDLFDIHFWLFALAFILFTGILAGCYPAFFLSAFRPVKVLKGVVNVGGSRITLRKILVVLQFSFTVFLMIATIVTRTQIIHAKNRDVGYNKELLIHIPLPEELAKHYPAFRNDLITTGTVTDMTKTVFSMTDFWFTTFGISWKGKDSEDRRSFNIYFADSNWAEMMGAEIVTGRFPNPVTFPTDSSAILINETTAKMIGFKDPIGEKLSFSGYEGQITGVIRDFVLHSPFEKPEPMVIGSEKIGWRSHIHIRLSPGNTTDKLTSIENVYKQYSAGYPFYYRFVEDDYAAKFKEVHAIESLTGFFTGVAILISCMGLFALAALTAERRRKEIGIRKVLGASISYITLMICKEYIVLTIIAFIISAPLAWIMMHQFLNMIDYRTNISVWLIATVGILILLITLLTVGFQAIKAATANPVKAIKTE
jgi:cell division protein FtsX